MVITDLDMPRMDGMTFIRQVRKMSGYAGVPIVFLTMESDADIKQAAKAAGATAWTPNRSTRNSFFSSSES